MTRLGPALVSVLAAALLAGCSDSPAAAPEPRTTDSPSTGDSSAPPTTPSSPETQAEAEAAPRVSPDDVRTRTAVRVVQHLAGEIGPRHGTSPEYREAASWVTGEFEALGYDVRRQGFDVPGGVSWGVPVDAGRSVNLLATRGDVQPGKPWLAVGAHLDTVPQAPGAEDNASGVGALLAVAEAMAETRTRLPVVLIAFGAEEPRGPTDDDHHYGSQHYVSELTPAERRSLRGMVSLDRVGVGDVLPVCSAASEPTPLRDDLLASAESAGVETLPCTGSRTSDHWSFVRNGLPGARLGDTDFAAYHSPADVPSVVNAEQLGRAARTTVAWLR